VAAFIELQTGEGAWLKLIRLLLSLTALIVVLSVNTSWAWKMASLVALVLVLLLIRFQIQRVGHFHRLRLYDNGNVTLLTEGKAEIPGVLEAVPWATRWISVLSVGRFDRWPRQQLLVCRSRNDRDDYRHMMCWLRLGSLSGSADGILGPR
jgi:hypothetical protein